MKKCKVIRIFGAVFIVSDDKCVVGDYAMRVIRSHGDLSDVRLVYNGIRGIPCCTPEAADLYHKKIISSSMHLEGVHLFRGFISESVSEVYVDENMIFTEYPFYVGMIF